MTEAFATTRPIDHLGLYRGFLERETDASGTVVLHHGRVKRPGKRVSDFSAVELKPLGIGVDDGLLAIARRAEAMRPSMEAPCHRINGANWVPPGNVPKVR